MGYFPAAQRRGANLQLLPKVIMETIESRTVQRPGIDSKLLVKAGITYVDEIEAMERTGFHEQGILIPYLDLSGEPLLDKGEAFHSLRLSSPRDAMKYVQRAKSSSHIYIPPGIDLGSARALVVVEGEFKALALWGRGIHAVGIKGFFGAGCPGKPEKLHPELMEILRACVGLRVIEFLGDADTAMNKEFSAAAIRFAGAISTEEPAIEVLLPRLSVDGPKGIDDAIEGQANKFDEFWRGLPRIELTDCPQEADAGASWLAYEMLCKVQDESLRAVFKRGGKSEQRLMKVVASIRLPRLQNIFKSRLVALGIPGLGKSELNRAIAAAGKQNASEQLKPDHSVIDRLDEIVSQAFVYRGTYLYPSSGSANKPSDLDCGDYMQMAQDIFRNYLIIQLGVGEDNSPNLPGRRSEVDYVLVKINEKPSLTYFGEVAGFPAGLHKHYGDYFFVPKGRVFEEGQPGECPTTIEYIQRLVGKNSGEPHWERQYHTLIGLLQRGRRMIREFTEPLNTPPLLLVGERDCGKTTFQTEILPLTMDGKHCHCGVHDLLGRFNSDQTKTVVTILSDAVGDVGYAERRKLGSYYKEAAANPTMRVEAKGKDKVTLPSKKIIVASANNQRQEDLAAVPPADGLEDKVIYLKCHPVNMWNGSNDPKGKEVMEAIRNEVVAFCYYVDNYPLPREVQGRRFGVATWQHPEIVESATAGNPSELVAEVISAILNDPTRQGELLDNETGLRAAEVAEILINGSPGIPQNYKSGIGNYLKYVKSDANSRPDYGFTVHTKIIKGFTRWFFSIADSSTK